MPIPHHSCPGPCNRAARTAWDTHDHAMQEHLDQPEAVQAALGRPTPPTVHATPGDPVWCGRCARLIRAALTDLDDLAALLAATADGHRGAGPREAKVGGTISKGSPSPSPIADTLDELYGALVGVEDNWREARGYADRPRRDRGGHARRLTITFLLDELDLILRHPGSVQFALATLKWQRRLRTLTRSDPASRNSPIRCPRCGERGRVRREDDGQWEYWRCGSCGRTMSLDEHDRERDEQAGEQEAADLSGKAGAR